MLRSIGYVLGVLLAAVSPNNSYGESRSFIQLNPSGPYAQSHQIESIYKGLVLGGRFPVYQYTVKKGDTVEEIIRSESGYSDPTFPVALDALACDLNFEICHRELALRDSDYRKSSQTVRLRSTFELESSYGNWNGLEEGDVIYLPAVTVQSTRSIKSHQKRRGQSFERLLRSLNVCDNGRETHAECLEHVEFLNPDADDFQATRYEGELFFPSVTYQAVIADECKPHCATTSFFTVDLARDRFDSPPYEIIENGGGLTNVPSYDFLEDSAVVLGEKTVRQLELLERSFLPTELQMKSSVGTEEHFHANQLDQLKFHNYPFEKISKNGQRSSSKVMIVDLNFEVDHCELESVFERVFDCSNAAIVSNAPESSGCVLREKLGAVQPDWASCTDPGNVEIEPPNSLNRDAVDLRHGTHSAGIIASQHNHDGIGAFGSAGINPFAELIAVQMSKDLLTSDARYALSLKSILVDLILENRIDVVSFGFGYEFPAPGSYEDSSDCPYRDAILLLICELRNRTLFVTPAGNEFDDNRGNCTVYPACAAQNLDNIMAVMALDINGNPLFPNAGNKHHTLGAIGKQVFGPSLKNKYGSFDGSSQAVAYAAGAASLATSFDARWRPPEFVQRFIACSKIPMNFDFDHSQGGHLDIDCITNFQKDVVTYSGGTRALTFENLVNSDLTGKIYFSEAGVNVPIPIPFDRVVGFQQIGNDPTKIVLFQKGSMDSRLVRKRGNFNGNPANFALRFSNEQEMIDIPLSEIAHYVRHSR